MLTKRQNLLETINGGNPDRFVNQYEAFELVFPIPVMGTFPVPGTEIKNGWGVTIKFVEGQPGPFPVHDDAHKVLKDVTEWKKYVKAPSLEHPEEAWTVAKDFVNTINREDKFVTIPYFTGIFEQLHYLMGMEDALMSFYEEPEAMHELIDYITEYELEYAKQVTEHLQPDALFHHDDWGSQRSSFISPEMFDEFIMPAYQKVYQYYKDNGVQVVIHHSDSYAANLVPAMIQMGVDIWQGCISTNNIPELLKQYEGKISFMGGIDNGKVDVNNWTQELIAKEVEKVCRECGTRYFIPCATMGGPESTYPGVYETVTAEIEQMSQRMF